MDNKAFNIRPADRLGAVNEYYFSTKGKEVAQMNAEGKDIISLAIGSPDMPPSQETIDVLCETARRADAHGYQPTVGTPELRHAMAGFYKRWYGVNLDPNTEIQPLIGSKEGILHVTLTFVNPGEEVLVPNPGYPTYTSLSKILGAEIVNYDLNEENGWQPDFDTLEKMDLSRVKLMWTNYPHMPTGGRARRETFEKLVDFALRHNIIIVNDNPYSFILNKGEKLSILQIPRQLVHTLVDGIVGSQNSSRLFLILSCPQLSLLLSDIHIINRCYRTVADIHLSTGHNTLYGICSLVFCDILTCINSVRNPGSQCGIELLIIRCLLHFRITISACIRPRIAAGFRTRRRILHRCTA